MRAIGLQHNKVIKYLISQGTPNTLCIADYQGYTALHYAAQDCRLDIIETLVKSGARMNDQNQDGNTPLHFMIQNKPTAEMIKTIEICIDKGCDVNITNKFGETPLYQAALKLKIEMVNYLLNKGANPNIKTCTGDSILHKLIYITNQDSFTIIKILLQFGIDVKAIGTDGKKPLDMLSVTPANKDLIVLLCEAEKKIEEKKEENTKKKSGWFAKSLKSLDKYTSS